LPHVSQPTLATLIVAVFAVLVLAMILLLPAALLPSAGAAESGAARHPAAVGAEQAFFAAFNQGAMPAEQALTPLMGAYATAPDDARTNLLLGLNHLWIAASAERSDPRVIEHLILSERFLERAQELAPDDRRIASWLVPVELSMAEIERRPGGREAIVADLHAAFEEDPAFHSFTMAFLAWDSANGSPEFQVGRAALHQVLAMDCAKDDPSCQNAPRWPHNVEGFLAFFADYELRAGNRELARGLLDMTQQQPTYAEWPYRGYVETRLAEFDDHAARFADDDPENDPKTVVVAEGCAGCHLGG
jgi:hypothetical protein